MKYGIREICDVVLKAKSKMVVGNKIFYKDEPVIYFDSLKTSTMEGAATTVYAQGGRGNSRLVAWEGERTVTFTMEDALISTVGLAILTGADVIEASETPVHVTERIDYQNGWHVSKKPHVVNDGKHYIYAMVLDAAGNPASEPYIFTHSGKYVAGKGYEITALNQNYTVTNTIATDSILLIDYYTLSNKTTQIEITPDKFGGNFYLEASTLFRDTNGIDMPAEFVIPNCKVQSNFTFSMASSGDPSTFTFTMDAFPDYTRWDKKKKVLSVIQIIEENSAENYHRVATEADESHASGADKVTNVAAPVATQARIIGTNNVSAGETVSFYAQTDVAGATLTWHFAEGSAEYAEDNKLVLDERSGVLIVPEDVQAGTDIGIEIKNSDDTILDGFIFNVIPKNS